MSVKVIDVYPDKAQYRPGDAGHIVVELEGVGAGATVVELHVQFCRLHETAWEERMSVQLDGKEHKANIKIPFTAPDDEWACYGVDVFVRPGGVDADDKERRHASTAFDVADHWRRAPRYGFLSDYHADESGDLRDVEELNKFHLNVIQFYDWMYRHDQLVPPGDEFVDPLGRPLSYNVVKEKLAAVHQKGMAAIAYGAVYAALRDFLDAHPKWGLYKRDGLPFHLVDIFYIMDISPDSKWTDWLMDQYRRVIKEGFDGIHMDQYGYPKKALRDVDGRREVVDLADCYPALIRRAKAELAEVNPDVGLIFNNVSKLSRASDGVRPARGCLHRGLAAYLPEFQSTDAQSLECAENGALLVMATIFASGGYHLLIGEARKVLTEGYYPNYGPLRPGFYAYVRRYYDFIVRYGPLLYDEAMDVSMTYTGGINTEVQFHRDDAEGAAILPNGDPGTVWAIVKQFPSRMVLHLINLVGVDNDHWAKGKRHRPTLQQNIECTVLMEYEVKGVYGASPDRPDQRPEPLPFDIVDHEQSKAIRFVVPRVAIWEMVYVEWEVGTAALAT